MVKNLRRWRTESSDFDKMPYKKTTLVAHYVTVRLAYRYTMLNPHLYNHRLTSCATREGTMIILFNAILACMATWFQWIFSIVFYCLFLLIVYIM